MMEVTTIFFEENSNYPSFELADGRIMKPYFNGNMAVKWMTENDFKQLRIKQTEEENARPFWKKILNLS